MFSHILTKLEWTLVTYCPFACYSNTQCKFILFTQCYKFVLGDDRKSWKDARKYCINQGGNLVSIHNEREQGERYEQCVANISFVVFCKGYISLCSDEVCK